MGPSHSEVKLDQSALEIGKPYPSHWDDSPLRQFVFSFLASKQALLGLVLLLSIVSAAVLAPWISPQNPYDLMQVSFLDSMLPPGEVGSDGYTHLLGTDTQGRDVLSAILFGLRISLIVAISSVSVAFVIGATVGVVSAFFGGWIDNVLMRIVEIQASIPAILVALVLLAVLGPGIEKIIIAEVIGFWASFARFVRGTALLERKKEYIEAALCLALPTSRILSRHLLVNCLPPVMVVFTVLIARAIGLEATLSFLGLGVPVTEPSLGLLISNGFSYLISGKYWVSFFPGLALILLTFGINMVGDHLRDLLNPRLLK